MRCRTHCAPVRSISHTISLGVLASYTVLDARGFIPFTAKTRVDLSVGPTRFRTDLEPSATVFNWVNNPPAFRWSVGVGIC